MTEWNHLPTAETLLKTAEALRSNGFQAKIVDTGEQAKQAVLDLIPKGAEVMTMTSVTLDTLGLNEHLNESGDYDSVKTKLKTMSRDTQHRQMQQLGAAPEWGVGSVHAFTEEGHVVIASNTGSQLPGYVYGAEHVVWVVGAQKLVKDTAAGLQRIYDYVLPLESERARKAYGVAGSNVSKLLIYNNEVNPQRVTIILVKESLGY